MNGSPATRAGARPPAEVVAAAVLAFVQAKPAEGGAGALVVLLAPVRR